MNLFQIVVELFKIYTYTNEDGARLLKQEKNCRVLNIKYSLVKFFLIVNISLANSSTKWFLRYYEIYEVLGSKLVDKIMEPSMTELGVERRGGGGNFPDHAKV